VPAELDTTRGGRGKRKPSLIDRFPALARLGLPPGRRIPFVQQLTETECGPACLAMVLGFHGKQVGMEQVREACGLSRDGVSARALLEAGGLLGLRGRAVKAEVEQLHLLPAGSTILHWEFQHFVVLARVGSGGAEIVDPAVGRRWVTTAELQRAFTGVALTFEPGELFARARRPRALWPAVRELARGSGLLPRILVLSLLLQLHALALPVLTGQVIDRVIPRGDLQLLVVLLAGMAALVGFRSLTVFVRGHLLLHLRTVLDARLTLGFLDHLVSLPQRFFQSRGAGDLMMRLNSNSVIREHLTGAALSGALDGLLVVVSLAILLLASGAMAAAALAAGVVDLAIFLLSRRRQRELLGKELAVMARAQSYEAEMFAAMETIKASGAEHRAVGFWSNLFVDQLNVKLARDGLAVTTEALATGVRALGPLAVLAIGAWQVLDRELTVGSMLALAAVAGGFLEPLANLVQTLTSLELARAYLDRINDVLQAEPEQAGDRRIAAPLAGRIELQRVSFRYDRRAPLAVREVDLRIEPGQWVAIVGRSGSGKTTLANLVLGLCPPGEGRVLFDGVDLQDLDLGSVRQQIGVVNQNVALFGSTIRENIALFDPGASLAEVEAAARLACIHEEIAALPMGYDTLLLDRGSAISGGQRQRLALARALLRRPAILLLDEATSALDTVTEEQVHRSLHSQRCTRLVIAHRLSTIRDADLILVMDQGRVVDSGAHQQLLARNGIYSNLVRAQLADS
jgi:ABC-type bacteriocin/lantibiotic exporter with double-glycine peptidase domain